MRMASKPRTAVDSWFGTVYILVDTDDRPYQPRKKFRHANRHYRALERKVAEFEISEGWYDFWHQHLDWNSDGNRSWPDRHRHLSAEFLLLRRLIDQTRGREMPHQVWLQIYPIDSGEDAIWMHTPNPQPNPFPFDFAGVEWDAPIPDRLREFITDGKLQFGRSDDARTIFWVRGRDVV
jgi:hypothetical protein